MEAARAVGVRNRVIMVRHILPNCLPALIVLFTLASPGPSCPRPPSASWAWAPEPPGPAGALIATSGTEFLFLRPLDRHQPGRVHPGDRAGLQLHGRRPAGRPRPAHEAMTTPAASPTPDGEVLLALDRWSTWFYTDDGVVKAVDGVSFDLRAGARPWAWWASPAAARPSPPCRCCAWSPAPGLDRRRARSGSEGRDLLRLAEARMRAMRGDQIAMIFQEPMTSLNPVFTVGDQMARGHPAAPGWARREARRRAVELLRAGRHPRRRAARATTIPTSSPAACASG